MNQSPKKKVVVIGGGTGVFTVLTALKNYPLHLQAIVSMADDGGSSGVLREEFGILPPGDIRRALIALSPSSTQTISKLFNYRFSNGSGLKGHSFGNLFLTALEKITGRFDKAIEEAGKILNIQGEVLPITLENTRLFTQLKNGVFVVGETNIDKGKYKHTPDSAIDKVFLNPPAKIYKEAAKAIENADYIIVGPGDLYTSIIPNFLVQGTNEAFRKSKAKKIFICNVTTKFSETNGFHAIDFLKTMERYIYPNPFDYFIVNNPSTVSQATLKKYLKEKKELVPFNAEDFKNYKKMKIIVSNTIRRSGYLRHDPQKLGKLLYEQIIR